MPDLETASQLYSVITKVIALILIATVTPVMVKQLAVKRLLYIKFAFIALAVTAFISIFPVMAYQLVGLLGYDNEPFKPYATIANSTSVLVTAGAMFVIYKTGE